MLVKRSEIIKGRALTLKKLLNTISKARSAVLFGSFVFLFVTQLYSQDQLLKEYIYLDGRLLAVERQSAPAIAQQPANGEDKDLSAVFAAHRPVNGSWLFPPLDTHDISIPHPPGSLAGVRQLSTGNLLLLMPDAVSLSSTP